MSPFEKIVHPHQVQRQDLGPVVVADQHKTETPIDRFNMRLALAITRVVGSMWCAYAFALFDLISLPAAIRGGTATIVAWIAQTFLQLVLLSVIMVGQNVQAEAADRRSEQMYKDIELLLHEFEQLHAHLESTEAVVTSSRRD